MAQVKRIRRSISGILVLDKPRGMSSNQALQKVRWLLNAEKAGHTGSLDPLATGVLPLCFGEATKFSQYLLDADKGYETVMRMGITTTTGDAEGELLAERDVTVGRDDLEQALPRFRGDIEQVPPMYSALKKDGQPLYKLARAGEVVEREARSVTITRLDLLSFEPPCATLAVSCSKGTYVRTLVEDPARSWLRRARRGTAADPGRAVRPGPGDHPRDARTRACRRWSGSAGPIPDAGRQRPVALAGVAVVRAQCVLLAARAAGPRKRRSSAGCGCRITQVVSSVSVK